MSEDLAALVQLVDKLSARLDEVDSLVRMVAVGAEFELDDVKSQLAALRSAPPEARRPDSDTGSAADPRSRTWAATATAQDWQDLAAWVDWLMATYELQPSRTILPCWPAHPGVTEELAALRQAWLDALARSEGPNEAMIFWHDRWLQSCVTRIREVSQIKLCADGHVPVRPARGVDTTLLAVAQSKVQS